jgi:hypothetical protein
VKSEVGDFIKENQVYRISNPRTYGRSDAKIEKVSYKNQLFNRLPSPCEIIRNQNDRHPFAISEISRAAPVAIAGSLGYDFLQNLALLEHEGFNFVTDICAIFRRIERSVVVTLLLGDDSDTEIAFILPPLDQRFMIGLDLLTEGTTTLVA